MDGVEPVTALRDVEIGRIKAFLLAKMAPRLLVLFGSAATGKAFRADSDIDLAFLGSRPITDEDRFLLAMELSAILHRDIDLVDLRRANPLLKFQIARDGVALHQASSGEFARFQVRAMQEHNDAQEFYRLDQEYIQSFLRGGDRNAGAGLDSPQID